MAEGGLLDFLNTPGGMGLLSAVGAGLANARRGGPLNAIGAGLMGGVQGYAQGQDLQRQSEFATQRGKLFDMQAAQLKQQQDAQARAEEMQRQQRDYLSGVGRVTSPRLDAQPNPASPRQMLSLGFAPEFIKTYMNADNLGKTQIKDYKEIRNPDGSVSVVGFDEFGNVRDTKQQPFKAPDVRDFGGYVGGVDPITGKVTRYGDKTMTPGERDASSRGWAGIKLQREQANRDAQAVTYQTDGAGNLVAVPTRVQPGRTISPIPVVGADGKPVAGKEGSLTEGQSKSYLFGTRAAEANRIIASLERRGVTNSGGIKRFAEGTGRVLGLGTDSLGGTLSNVLGSATNWTQSAEQQQAEQAKRDFINAVLRKESGAVIGTSEFDNAEKQYFPQPGDDAATIAQKARNRQLAIDGVLAEVPSSRRPKSDASASSPKSGLGPSVSNW